MINMLFAYLFIIYPKKKVCYLHMTFNCILNICTMWDALFFLKRVLFSSNTRLQSSWQELYISKSISICNILTEMFRLVTQKFILQFQASNLMKKKKKTFLSF